MSTRSRIAMQNPDGSYSSVYCHYDGTPQSVGRILNRHYQTAANARKIIGLGNISSLGERAEPTGPHSWAKPQDGVTLAYGRDRGDKKQQAQRHPDFEALKEATRDSAGNYLHVLHSGADAWKSYDAHRNFVDVSHQQREETGS